MWMHVGGRSVQYVRMVLNLKKKVVAQDGFKIFSGHKRRTSYLAICVHTPMFTEYSCTVEPVHNEQRRKETMATMSKWHPKVHTCIQIHQVHNKHISGYIEQTLYTWWSLNCSGQPLQHLVRSKISLFPHLIDYFLEFMNSTSAADRLLTMLLLHTDCFIQIRNSHAKVSLASPT